MLRYEIPSLSDQAVILTAQGIEQAQLAAQALLAMPELDLDASRVDSIIASPFARTIETASIIARQFEDNFGKPVTVKADAGLSKRDVGYFWNFTYEGVRLLHPEEWQLFRQKGELHYRPPAINGIDRAESFVQVIARARRYLRSLTRVNGGSGNQCLVAVTHSHFIAALLYLTQSLSRREMLALYQNGAIPNCAMLLLEYDGSHWLPRII